MKRKEWFCTCSREEAKLYMSPGYFQGWKDKEIRESERWGKVDLYGIMINPPTLTGKP